ncbi:CG8149 [Drosophila busckii]|uniref:CG8149 n=1 Tax=Drosophila busckii TaxID=30019 RepID=A0A0M3QY54_DROBS|nr:SAFB-like transcription modulator [Drosophila busckii]ALC47083.1 CG8149 [Drosophila busckii]
MPESDVTKMKVADLKRELKLRGLPINGNKNELQDRLQTALLEGDISLEDSAIADAIDDDVLLDDEDEHKLLGDDHEDLLLKSPVNTPITEMSAAPDLSKPTTSEIDTEANAAALPSKKIVLKRNNSQLQMSAVCTTAATTPSKENAAPDGAVSEGEKTPKSTHKPIVVGGSGIKTGVNSADKKLGELSIQERLELRAKKFGITVEAKADSAKPAATADKTTPVVVNKSSSASIKANKGDKETEEQQKEALKRRAERFGCIVPEKSAKTSADERLQKRKERFGGATAVSDSKGQGDWAEKARARLERFKPSTSPAVEAAAATTTTE